MYATTQKAFASDDSDDRRRLHDTGVVFVATGARYVAMARNAVAGLRKHSPGLAAVLYTDNDDGDAAFDWAIRLEQPWRRSKIDAMIASPFERTLYIDADVFITADLRDVFDLLDRFDIALAHDQERNGHHATTTWRRPFGAAFPQYNSGVIAFRRSPGMTAFLTAWRDAVRDNDMPRDQPALRELLWDSDLRIATLPPEYNLMDLSTVTVQNGGQLAPRIIHHYRIHRTTPNAPVPASIREMLGPATEEAISRMIAADHHIAAAEGRAAHRVARWRKWLLQARLIAARAITKLRR